MSNILLLEDDLSLINGLSFAFKKQGFELVVARTLKEADSLWLDGKYDLLVLDVSLPDGTGFEFCKKVRQVSKVPIIFLTAADEEMNIIMGLDIGGDDYIRKPYSLHILLAKVKVTLNRYGTKTSHIYENRHLYIDFSAQKVSIHGQPIKLKTLEYRLLCYLIENRNKVLTKEEIFNNVWRDHFTSDGTLNVHIRHLREKIEENPDSPIMIQTIWGVGYTFVEQLS